MKLLSLSALACAVLALASSAFAGDLVCDQVLNPNVSGKAETSVTAVSALTLRGDTDRDLSTNWDWMGAVGPNVSILAFQSDCADQITKCSTDPTTGLIHSVTQYSGGDDDRNETVYDVANKRLHVTYSTRSFLFYKARIDVLLQCH